MNQNSAPIIPNVGIKSRYTAGAPFDTIVLPNESYVCIKVQDYSTALSEGDVDLFSRVYEPVGLSEDILAQHLSEDVLLITLKSETGVIVEVPSVYLRGLSTGDSVAYVSAMIGVDIGPIESSQALGQLKEDIEDIVKKHLGIDPIVKLVYCSAPIQLDRVTHEAIVKKRTQNSLLQPNKEAIISQLRDDKIGLQSQIKALVKFIRNKGLVP